MSPRLTIPLGSTLALFQKQTKNVQHLRKVIKQLNQDINESIQKSNTLKEDIRVNLLALTYSAWSEAQFIQIIFLRKIIY